MESKSKKLILALHAEEMVSEDSYERGEIRDIMSLFIDDVKGKTYRSVKDLTYDLDAPVEAEDAFFMNDELCWDFYTERNDDVPISKDDPVMEDFKAGKMNLEIHRVRVKIKIVDAVRDPEEGEMEREFGVKELKD